MAAREIASQLESNLREARARLLEAGLEHALVGGMAVSAVAEPRFTRDIDLAVAVEDDRQAESLVQQLLQSGYEMLSLLEHETSGRLATVRLTRSGEENPTAARG